MYPEASIVNTVDKFILTHVLSKLNFASILHHHPTSERMKDDIIYTNLRKSKKKYRFLYLTNLDLF